MSKLPKNLQKGQALVIVLLTITAVLTLVLSVVSRSVTEVSITSFEENAIRAFSAAESGVEKVLLNPDSFVGQEIIEDVDKDQSVSFTANVEVKTPGSSFRYPKDLVSGETATFWLAEHSDERVLDCDGTRYECFNGNTLTFCWDNPNSQPSASAIEVFIFYTPSGSATNGSNNFEDVRVKRYAYDPNPSRRGENGFGEPTPGAVGCDLDGNGQNEFANRVDVDLSPLWENELRSCRDNCTGAFMLCGCFIKAKVRMYYADSPQRLAISADEYLPAQGYQITSTGVAAEASRRVSVFQGYPEPPDLFEAALFSVTDIIKTGQNP